MSELFVAVRLKKVREIRDQTKGAEGQQAQSQLQRKLVTVKGSTYNPIPENKEILNSLSKPPCSRMSIERMRKTL